MAHRPLRGWWRRRTAAIPRLVLLDRPNFAQLDDRKLLGWLPLPTFSTTPAAAANAGDVEVEEALDLLTVTHRELRTALDESKQRVQDLFEPLVAGVEKWSQSKLPGANADDDALIAELYAFTDRCAAKTKP